MQGALKQARYRLSDVIEKCKDINGLAAISLPHVFVFAFPQMFVYFWQKCTTLVNMEGRGFPQFALGIPRGHAKTVFLKLFIVFCVLFTRRKFILVICSTSSLAESIVTDVADMLSHTNIRKVFGNWDADLETDRKDTKIFNFRGRTVILKGVGVGTNFRGIAEKVSRPDVMIFDDAQSKDCAASATLAKEYQDWFYGTALKAKDPFFCFVLYVGNIYKKLVIQPAQDGRPELFACLLKNLKNSPDWESIVVGAILADGTALWEDLQPKSQLVAEYLKDWRANQEHTFLAEVMNDDEAGQVSLFDATTVPAYPYTDYQCPEGHFLVIDPSVGRSTSDRQVVGECKVIDGDACLVDLIDFQVSAPELVRQVLDLCYTRNIGAIAIEDYSYQATLAQWFEFWIAELGIEGINILTINRGRKSKNSGILSVLREIQQGDLLVAPQARAYLWSEIANWNPLKDNNVDNALDVATYCNLVRLKYTTEILSPILIRGTQQIPTRVRDIGMSY